MRFMRSVVGVLTAFFVVALAQVAATQETDPYVSCVKCHALPMQQAQASMQGHGIGYLPTPEQVCDQCHDTWFHEQNPDAPPSPLQPYFLFRAGNGSGSPLSNACLSCHTVPAGNHPSDVFPYFDATPLPLPPLPPTSVLPLFTATGQPNQNPGFGGIVCSTCHDPHDPSYAVDGRSKFLRIGSPYDPSPTAPLCGYCHTESTPITTGADLFIESNPDSVRFQLLTDGRLQIDVTVKNRGNVTSGSASVFVFWEDATGYRTPIGPIGISPLAPDTQSVVRFTWTPPPTWTLGDGFFVFQLPPRPLLGQYSFVEFVRSMDVTPAPTNLRVTNATPGEIYLAWDPPLSPPADLGWDVYRDGVKVTPAPVFSPSYTDFGLAPETPHVYTVVAVRMLGGLSSQPSDPVGGTTAMGAVFRVPQDYPTIQAAINAAGYVTSIHVAPGTYTESLNLAGKYGITIKGQDANGCVIDYTGTPANFIDLGPVDSLPGNTLSGFTVRNGMIHMSAGDVVTGCVIVTDSSHPIPPLWGGGLVAQCVFDTGNRTSIQIDQGQILASVNSIYLGSQPFYVYPSTPDAALLLNNNFPYWTGYAQYEGSGNYSVPPPVFAFPGPPTEYMPADSSPTVNRGLPLGAPFEIGTPDIGVFEAGQFYTPQPPKNLAAALLPGAPDRIRLTWTASIDDPGRMWNYYIYRSESPAFPPATMMNAYFMVPVGMTFFEDSFLAPGTTYYYQVRAFAGPSIPPSEEDLLSAPTNTASATTTSVNNPPIAVNDTAITLEDQAITLYLLANDSDPDGDPLVIEQIPGIPHATHTITATSVTVTPDPNYNGSITFSYLINDGRGGLSTANVSIAVTPVNDMPVFVKGANQTVNNNADTQMVTGWATGIGDGDPEVSQMLMFNVTNDNSTLFAAQPGIMPDGTLIYTPAANTGGVATVTVRLTDDSTAGGPAITTPDQTFTITVNRPPDAFAQSVTTTKDTPLAVTLHALDMDGDALTYAVVSGPTHGSLSGILPNLMYFPAVGYTGPDSFSFTANDGRATSVPATVTITVNSPPVANAGADQSGNIGQVLTFSAAASYDPDGTIANNYIWIWGDNTAGSFSTVTATHSYANPGTYTVTLTVFDNNGATATDTLIVTVNAPPVANAGADQTGNIGQVLSFSGAASTDPDGTIVSYSWNWGDGTAPGTGVGATHAYATAGSKTVTLTVTDNGGATATDTLVVTVNRVNLALNMTARASSTYDSATAAAMAVDGTTTTFWRSAKTTGNQYISVDLGSAKSISNVMVSWPATYYAKAFTIETSTDGSKWTQRYATTTGSGGVTNATFTAVSARHVRVSCTKANSTSYRVAELEVYQ